jgi:hypothetical protein
MAAGLILSAIVAGVVLVVGAWADEPTPDQPTPA